MRAMVVGGSQQIVTEGSGFESGGRNAPSTITPPCPDRPVGRRPAGGRRTTAHKRPDGPALFPRDWLLHWRAHPRVLGAERRVACLRLPDRAAAGRAG